MKIQEAATKIISCWEHTGHYDCHGDGAYGLIGWEGGQLVSLLEHYEAEGGKLDFTPPQYNPLTAKLEPELNERAKDPLMQQVQREQASHYMTSAIRHQQQFYPFATPLGQLILCDIGVNSGIWNFYVAHAGNFAGEDEASVINAVMTYRKAALKRYGIWQQYKGIQRRWEFYEGLLANVGVGRWGKSPLVMMTVNGVKLKFSDHEIEPLAA